MATKRADPAEAARLLVKAIGTLSERERQQVMEYLVTQLLSSRPQESQALVGPQLSPLLGMSGPEPGENLRTVPVRFSEERYTALKDWCQANSFSMAVVLRGLVDRFLEQQLRAS